MESEKFSQELFDFVAENSAGDPAKLRLKGHGKSFNFNYDLAVIQIACRNKYKRKLGSFLKFDKFLFPSEIAAEQASHEAVAAFHASLLNDCVSLLDMTAGLGIDALSMSSLCKEVTACELDSQKAEILSYNVDVLGKNNVDVVNSDSIEWLKGNNRKFDVIYIDPARRGENNSRVYNFHDCKPDVMENLNLLIERSRQLFIKASPLLDISQTLKDIRNVSAVRVICVAGECKEVLIEVTSKRDKEIYFEAIDLTSSGGVISDFAYTGGDSKSYGDSDNDYKLKYAQPEDISKGNFLYEPNAAVMKLACWNQLQIKFPDLKKFDSSSHLFVSQSLYRDFPGRIMEIERIIDKKERKTLNGLPLNVVVRNYPISADQLRKELKVKEGTDRFIYGSRIKSPLLILAKRINLLSVTKL